MIYIRGEVMQFYASILWHVVVVFSVIHWQTVSAKFIQTETLHVENSCIRNAPTLKTHSLTECALICMRENLLTIVRGDSCWCIPESCTQITEKPSTPLRVLFTRKDTLQEENNASDKVKSAIEKNVPSSKNLESIKNIEPRKTRLEFKEEIVLKKGNLIGVLPLQGKSWSVSLKIKPTVVKAGNILLFKDSGDVRALRVFFSTGIDLVVASNAQNKQIGSNKTLPINVYTTILVQQQFLVQGIYQRQLFENGSLVATVNNTNAKAFQNVKIYASNPAYKAANAVIKDLMIESSSYGKRIKLEKGNLIDVLPIQRKAWSVSFTVKPFGVNSGKHKSILHFTKGEDEASYGDRNPGLWFNPGTTKIHVASSTNGKKDYNYTTSTQLSIGQTTHIKVVQSKNSSTTYQLSIYINGSVVHSVKNTDARTFENVKVYAGDPWYVAANAEISNFVFTQQEMDKDIALEQNNLIEVIPLQQKSWEVSFQIIPFGRVKDDVGCILHFTRLENANSYGDRNPMVYFEKDTTILSIESAVNGDKSHKYKHPTKLPIGATTMLTVKQLKVSEDVYSYTITINGSTVYSVENKQATSFPNVKVFATDPWSKKANARINNLVIKNPA